MPIPRLKTGEAEKDFLSRCMDDAVMTSEYPQEKQRYAICLDQWEKDKMKAKFLSMKQETDLGPVPPEWFQIFPAGQILILDDEPAIMDEESAVLVINGFEGSGNDMVIDYEHQTLSGERAPAAGWIKEMQWRGDDGLWVRTEWTDQAAEYIKNKEYRYFSPVFLVRKSDRKIVKIYNAALTNQPRLINIQALAAKYEAKTINKEESLMWEKLKKLLGLADDAGEDAIVEAAQAIVAKNKELEEAAEQKPAEVIACKEVLDVLKLGEDADKTAVIAAIGSLGKTDDVAKELSLQVAKLTMELSEMKQFDLVELALKEGKTSPDELDKWGRDLALRDPGQFKMIVLSRPKGSVIPVDSINLPKEDLHQGTSDEVQLSINKMMGVDLETWKKYNPDAQTA